jgi:hypothetical protein
MWDCVVENEAGGRVRRFRPQAGSMPMSYRDVLRRWQDDQKFRSWFLQVLSDAPFSAYRWETPPITSATQDRDFEFVLVDTPGLVDPADAGAFADKFRKAAGASVVSFENLGKDATLIVPCPLDPNAGYSHLADFVRTAPERQKHELWQAVGKSMALRLNEKPVWLSTAGMGVVWLHVRLDSRPKYYAYDPYRKSP